MRNLNIIGKREIRVDALGKVTGAAKYADDYNRTHQLYGAVKYAEFPHAEISEIDTNAAEHLSGVEALLTHKDVPGKNSFGLIPNIRILADDRTRYIGDVIAIVAAQNKEIAQSALNLIKVTYKELPAVFDPEEALENEAIAIHEDGNEIVHHKLRKGDIEKGFAEADFIIENKFGGFDSLKFNSKSEKQILICKLK